ncbi:glucose-1-phosphate adenylyltransferase [Aeromonas hydrophila]|uniref:glucose-1-phosphate adenylyltransferase n=1 Tax=Aeromonas hydrophila TaxID=644 RepID=UPI000C78BDB9|nr:glucose-1-phosphate adenylyltransferase [Aeromonas hydrophila]AWA07152.1 glucose-1-phosphate adenylyltransferase [Aeromonas hydrophila subsp. hydrophila]MBW3834645.1 glucose-1-phosphate adenylyltransferase [Aeromonas hydrophila]MBW5266945.1 glucose-1-phosphate adenylyltransferase [Aeromonas hydrophila]MBW5278125.1 glucose-1-phosphate adenylyltransferase [Aeromonas hydrophila]MCX4114880.1 glucose-1-phosphate adenylyltransferase [Aeromonas hydrophila]
MLLQPANTAQSRQLLNETMALVLAGGRGSRLKQLTDNRAKPAVHFGGKFRIIDFVLSNCINSGIRRVGVVTQYKSHSLLRHLQSGWSFLRYQMNEFIDLLPAQQRVDEVNWYRGTADAVYQNLDIIRDHGPKYVVVLAGDHIYKMDYAAMLLDHVNMGARVTVACIEVPRDEASAFGVMAVDGDRKINAFVEKPANPPAMPGKPDTALASMGVYIFEADYLYQLLEEDLANPVSHHDFGMDVIPRVVQEGTAYAHPFSMSCVGCCPQKRPYWRDVGTVDSFWEANMDLASVTPELDIYDQDWPIWTSQNMTPPAKFVQDRNGQHGMTINSMFAGGTIVSGSFIVSSVLFTNVRVDSFCTLDQAVIFPGVEIGPGCRLRRVVIDKGCKLPEGLVVGENACEDARRFYRSEQGIVLVTKEMLARL